MELFIWYNPKIGCYQQGNKEEYQRVLIQCKDIGEPTLLYELNELSSRLANKILTELNTARSQLKMANA
jgi:hypothetical protein